MKEKVKNYIKGQDGQITLFLLAIGLFLIVAAFCLSSPSDIFSGIWLIFKSPDILTTDYVELASIGAALFNSGLMTLIMVGLIKISKSPMSGISIAAVLITTGFSLFGKNLPNSIPIILGVVLYTIFKKEKFSKNVNTAIFGATMGPLVSELFSHTEWPLGWAIAIGAIVGIVIGFILPAVASFTMNIHQGYVLYNVGVAAGTIVVAAVSIMRVAGFQFSEQFYWNKSYTTLLTWMFIIVFIVFCVVGFLLDRKGIYKALKMTRYSGRAVTDYIVREGVGPTLINMGLLGIMSIVFTRIVGAPINGPTLGAIITIVGFGAFGNNLRNVIYIFLGGLIGHLCGLWDFATDSDAILAILFATGIAPIGGQNGWFWGIVSGFLHVFIVKNVERIHAGLTLYSNGFAGMFDAIILLPIIEIFKDPWRKFKNRISGKKGGEVDED